MVEYECEGQMSIFDFITPKAPACDFDTMGIEEAGKIIGEATGLFFKPDDRFEIMNHKRYIAKSKGYLISINFNNFSPGIHNGRRYLGLQIDKGTWGCGTPAESIEEAIRRIKEKING